MTFRVYFNRRGPLPWSVDSGIGTVEHTTKMVHWRGCVSRTEFAPSAGNNRETPTAWIEVGSASMHERDGHITLEPEPKRVWAQ